MLDGTGASHRNDCPAALMREIAPCLAMKPAPDAMEDLLCDVDDRMRSDNLARRHRQSWNAELREKIAESDAPGFLAYLEANLPPHLAAMTLDQWSALEGNPLYPTWRAKSGLPTADVIFLSPEFGARVSLRIAALRKDWVYAETMPHVGSYSEWFSQKFPDLWLDWVEGRKARNQSPEGWLPFPIHTWHVKNFVRPEFAAAIASGILHPDGAEIVTLPSISFRTTEPRPFIKLPVATWMTSTQRNLWAKAVHMGPRLSALISGILSEEDDLRDGLEVFVDELDAILHHPDTGDEHPGRLLSVIYRNTDPLVRQGGLLALTVAALLTASPFYERPLICELIARNGNDSAAAVGTFFHAYARSVIRPMPCISSTGLLSKRISKIESFSMVTAWRGKLLIRYFIDARTLPPLFKARGYDLKPFSASEILPATLNDDISLMRSFLIHACFVCHLHEVALCLQEQYSSTDNSLWRILREKVKEAFDLLRPRMLSEAFWVEERKAFLERPWPTRSGALSELPGRTPIAQSARGHVMATAAAARRAAFRTAVRFDGRPGNKRHFLTDLERCSFEESASILPYARPVADDRLLGPHGPHHGNRLMVVRAWADHARNCSLFLVRTSGRSSRCA